MDKTLATFSVTKESNGAAVWQLAPTVRLVKFIPGASIERGHLELQGAIQAFVAKNPQS